MCMHVICKMKFQLLIGDTRNEKSDYYSGTGNSLRTAMTIADKLGDTVLYSVRNNPEDVAAKDADVIGFVCPVYEWDDPGIFKSFIKELDINPNAYIFMVATYTAVHGRCFETVEEILSEKWWIRAAAGTPVYPIQRFPAFL